MGRNTHAIWAVVVRAKCVVVVSVAASRLPPGAPVVSISAYEELPVCVKGVIEGEGVWEGEGVTLGVTEGVPVGLGEFVRVPLGVVVTVLEGVAVAVTVGDCEGVAPGEREGVGVCEGIATPTTNRGAAYMVPALVTSFHAFVVRLPEVPVHTLDRYRRP